MRIKGVLSRSVISISMALAALLLNAQCQTASTATKLHTTVFTIGKEDGSDVEFRNYGWTGKDEFTFRAEVDTDAEFPAELHVPGAYVSYGVVRLKIAFITKQPYSKAILRLVRGGDETSVITVDGQRTFKVTSSMLGSGEGFKPGSYELDIGRLEKGAHELEFTVQDDGRGNGAYQWDALELFGAPEAK